jgi:hypothetical protein
VAVGDAVSVGDGLVVGVGFVALAATPARAPCGFEASNARASKRAAMARATRM